MDKCIIYVDKGESVYTWNIIFILGHWFIATGDSSTLSYRCFCFLRSVFWGTGVCEVAHHHPFYCPHIVSFILSVSIVVLSKDLTAPSSPINRVCDLRKVIIGFTWHNVFVQRISWSLFYLYYALSIIISKTSVCPKPDTCLYIWRYIGDAVVINFHPWEIKSFKIS